MRIGKKIRTVVVLFFATLFGGVTAFAQVSPTPTPQPSDATTTPVSVVSFTGVSNSFLNNGTTQGPQMFGGFVGSADTSGPCTPNSDGTCNNCKLAVPPALPVACNTKRILATTTFTIRFTVETELAQTGSWYAILGYDGPNSSGTLLNSTTVGPIVYRGTYDISGKWGDLCANLGLTSSNCDWALHDPVANGHVVIFMTQTPGSGYTSSNTGYSTSIGVSLMAPDSATQIDVFTPSVDAGPGYSLFNAQAGDQEVLINPITLVGTCPTNGFLAARVFYWPDDNSGQTLTQFQNASYGAPLFTDLSLDENCNPSGDWVISGLTNDQGYFFDIAMVDLANNAAFLLDPNYEVDPTVGTCGNSPLNIYGPGANPANDAGCPFYATPSEVAGLLPKDFNCFIATAAYGSPFAPAVKTLREFRNIFLYPSNLGRKFVKFYYRVSPFYAHIIAKNEFLRSVARVSLAPLWGFAWLSLHYSPLGVLLMISSLLVFIIVSARRYRRGEW